MSMLLFAGDTHGHHAHLARIAQRHQPAAIIHVGDLGLTKPFADALADVRAICPVYFIAGNHDFDTIAHHDCLFSDTREWNLHGRVIEVDGVRIAGLAGNFQGRVWHPPKTPRFARRTAYLSICGQGNRWRGGLPLKRRGAIWREDYDALSEQRADVLITHEAPGCHRYGFDVLSELGGLMGCTHHVHGHVHDQYNTTLDNGVQVHGIGLRGIGDIQGHVIRKGEPDDARPGQRATVPI
jgi:hypothetical protein